MGEPDPFGCLILVIVGALVLAVAILAPIAIIKLAWALLSL